jgi:hypothetical protein
MTNPQSIPVSQATALIAAFFAGAKFHPRQVVSFSHGVIGAMYAERAGIAHFGRAMARMRGATAKHAIKQLDLLLGSEKVPDEEVFRRLIGFVLSNRSACVVALDWTEYAAEGHHRIALSLVTRHGRASPLTWKIVRAEDLKERRNDYEDELLRQFKRLIPASLHEVVLLADRGFGDFMLYDMLRGRSASIASFASRTASTSSGTVRPGKALTGYLPTAERGCSGACGIGSRAKMA